MATPITQNQHSETCSLKAAGQEVSVTGTFGMAEGGTDVMGDSIEVVRPTQCVITVVESSGESQVLTLDGDALSKLRLLLERMYSVHGGPMVGAIARVIGGPRR